MKNEFDLEQQSEWLETIQIEQYDATSVMLASKLAREVRKRSGVTISLSDKNVFKDLGQAVLKIGDRDLSLIYDSLLTAVVVKKEDMDDKPVKSSKSIGSKLLRSLNSLTSRQAR